MSAPVRIAMWSGPRNISTAMMRAFENRPDTSVSDEPFYAAYLATTGLDHPMRAEVLASQPHAADKVVAALLGPVPDGKPVWYQKHMTHHMLPQFDRSWIDNVTNAFLLREPEAVLASYVRRRSEVTLADIGLPQQVELFERVADRRGVAPPVIESDDILTNPERALGALCRSCGISFDAAMLAWRPGPRPTDGAWAPAWYDQVEASSSFAPPRRKDPANLPEALQRVADEARPYYEALARHRMTLD